MWLYSEGLPGSFLVPTVDGTDCEGVVCPQDQSRTGVVLTGTHLLTRTGGGVRGDYHTIPLHSMLRGEGGGPLEGDHWTSRREQKGTGGGGGGGRGYKHLKNNMAAIPIYRFLPWRS